MFDFSHSRTPAELIDDIFAARRNDRRDLIPQILRLTEHESPHVREEAAALLLVKWSYQPFHEAARSLLKYDSDFAVRARVAFGLATISVGANRASDGQLLAQTYADPRSPSVLKCACFEALCWMVGRPTTVELDDTDATSVAAMVAEIQGDAA